MGIEEGEKVPAKVLCNLFNKIIAEIFSNIEKEMPIQVLESYRIPKRHDQNRTSP
jgi:hypothetical protein